jgi:succinate dehydrogenase/fumarate reductase flavoprotein subunit
MYLRRKQILKVGIESLEETTATALLTDEDGKVSGVFCLDILKGEYVVVRAKAVVMATGYSDRLHVRSTGTREMSADGIALAWRAGATLVNMEMQWWHTNDASYPPTWQRIQIYPNPMLGSEKSARMVNAEGEEFFNQQEDDPLAFGPYTVQLKALAKQVRAGKARYEGGYYAGFDHCDPQEVENYTTYAKPFRQLGLDFPRNLLETAVTSHYRQGGIDVDTSTMRSSVPGLYVAGGVGGHSNGLIALATYDGFSVAESVANDLDELTSKDIPQRDLDREAKRLSLLRESRGSGLSPGQLKEKIRKMMWAKAGVEKNAGDLKSALNDIEEIRGHSLPEIRIANSEKPVNYEWLDAIDAVNMLDACELIVQSSLERKESRGPFFRQDYPLTDNNEWLCANVLQKSGNGIRFSRRPYALPTFRPGFAIKDNFEVPW